MTYQGWRSINAPVSINLSRCPAYIKASLFVRDTPARCGEVIKRLAATSSTGISPPHGSHAAALIACDGFTLENAITPGL